MMILLLLAGLGAFTFVEPYKGELVGTIETIHHDVTARVFVVDENRLRLQNFTYDGKGPDAFFFIGDKNGGPAAPSGQGTIMMDQYGRSLILDAYVNADIVLTLPDGVTVNDINWLSVWCRQAAADFGHLNFPDSLQVPGPVSVGEFSRAAHGVRSGDVTVLDKRTIRIEDLHYDGLGPDAYFWVGTGSVPDVDGYIVPNEHGSTEILSGYNGETVTLTLPRDMTVDDIGHLSLWCRLAKQNFGHVVLGDLMVPPYTMHLEAYNGKLVGNLRNLQHGVHGTVYLLDSDHIKITNFFYDGLGPDAYVYVGDSESPDTSGTILPVLGSEDTKLGLFEDEEIIVELPSGKSFSDYKWLSIWCVSAEVNFGDLMIPETFMFREPEPLNIGEFSRKGHGVRSDNATILNARTILIENLHYDGLGPDAFFYVGTGEMPSVATGMKIPDETGSMAKAHQYDGDTITLTLPDHMTFLDIDWLSIYCISFTENFGHVMITDDLNVPGYMMDMSRLANCEKMHDTFNMAWEVDGDYIHFEFTGVLEENRYMAFGLSGSDTSSVMGGGDVSVVSYRDQPIVEDLLLNAYAQCSAGVGVCADDVQGGTYDIEDVTGSQVNGVTTVKFKRKLDTGDQKDKVYGGGAQFVIWALGNINMDSMLVTKHDIRLQGDKTIDFNRDSSYNCAPITANKPPPEVKPWKIPPIYGSMSNIEFEVCIGPAGPQENGYTAITGTQSWGIAWFVDSWLIPELVLERGTTYTFKVYGGDDEDQPATYHPFYITNDPEGGYNAKTAEDRDQYDIYAGPKTGSYCEYKTTSASPSNTDSFEDYRSTLNKECDGDQAGTLTWTPNETTPDMVYYQCYTHKFLGFKIKVVDEIMVSGGAEVRATVSVMTAIVTVTFALIQAMY